MPESQQPPLLEISSEISQIYKAHFGRGPTSIRTYQIGNTLVSLLESVNSPAQTVLLERGERKLAHDVHRAIQLAMADELRAVVERVTGRVVRGYVPGSNLECDASTDVFHLEPLAP